MQKFVIKRTSHDFNLRTLLCDDIPVGRIVLHYLIIEQLTYFISDVLNANVVDIKINKTTNEEIDDVTFSIDFFNDNMNRK